MKNISVIGAGSWGTTLAILLAEKGFDVKILARRQEIADEINNKKENSEYLPGVKIPLNCIADTSLKNAVEHGELLLSVVPSEFLRSTVKEISRHYRNQIIVSATKGIEHHTGKRMSQVIEDEIANVRIAVLSGPNHAEEVSTKLPTASVVASKNKKIGRIACACLNTPTFKTYPHDDVIGVEICGALKNISAIATGVCDGFSFGDNARASIMTLGLMEMSSYGKHFGAKRGTFYGLAGVGDLIATCSSRHSRNRFVGEQLAKGKSVDQIRKEMKGMVAEGIPTTRAVYEYCAGHGIEMPLTRQAYEVLFNKKNIKEAIKDLLKLV